MRKEQTIIGWAEENCEGLDEHSLQVSTFDSRAEAQDYIIRNLNEESKELDTPLEEESGSVKDLWRSKEGTFSYRVGDHVYHISFLNVGAEYKVSDDEVFSALDAYANSNRSHLDYSGLAARISASMHRYVQNELWKFVKHLIRAFAAGGSDERNRTASRQAALLAKYMDKQNV